MSGERFGPNPQKYEEPDRVSPEARLSVVSIEGRNSASGYTYGFGFIFDHPVNGPYIRIDTEQRQSFLSKGSEQQAQDALIALGQQTRQSSGGYFNVHPFQGAVWGTKLTPVAPGFLTDAAEPGGYLTMFIDLHDADDRFDNKWIRKALEIGTNATIPGSKSRKVIDYIQAPKPDNQPGRNQAIENGLGGRWDKEFRRFHKGVDVPPAITLSPRSIIGLMRQLENNAALTDLVVWRINHAR